MKSIELVETDQTYRVKIKGLIFTLHVKEHSGKVIFVVSDNHGFGLNIFAKESEEYQEVLGVYKRNLSQQDGADDFFEIYED